MNHPTDPTTPDEAAWEEAMSRDFDVRVRDLHEAPLDVSTVKGKARKIKRNRRAAVAGGILGVAAIVTPVAVLANGDADPRSDEPAFVDDPADAPAVTAPDYLQGTTWHQEDGDAIELEHEYYRAVQWGDRLVATRVGPEVYYVTEVLDQDGRIIRTIGNTTSPVVVNDLGTTIAWVNDAGQVMTAWEGGEASLGSVERAAPGEVIAWRPRRSAAGRTATRRSTAASSTSTPTWARTPGW